MLAAREIRQYARRVPPLYYAVGVARLLTFRLRLAAENRRYEAQPKGLLPPPILRYRVHGALDAESYANAGRVLAGRIVSALRQAGLGFDGARILDFACGPGRVAAEVKQLEPKCQLWGSDIDGEAIHWASTNLSRAGTFGTNDSMPPLSYRAGFFDAAYTISLFTHLDEAAQAIWLAELRRVVKPGGVLLATVHGATATASCTSSELRQLDECGFAYRVDRTGKLKLDGLPDTYQTTFHTRRYVESEWSRWFEIETYIEGGLEGYQDLIVLRRPRGT